MKANTSHQTWLDQSALTARSFKSARESLVGTCFALNEAQRHWALSTAFIARAIKALRFHYFMNRLALCINGDSFECVSPCHSKAMALNLTPTADRLGWGLIGFVYACYGMCNTRKKNRIIKPNPIWVLVLTFFESAQIYFSSFF